MLGKIVIYSGDNPGCHIILTVTEYTKFCVSISMTPTERSEVTLYNGSTVGYTQLTGRQLKKYAKLNGFVTFQEVKKAVNNS